MLREAAAKGVRLGALEQASFRAIADVLEAPAHRLLAVPGIGPRTAEQVTAAARRVAAQVASDTRFRFDPDRRGPGETRLLATLAAIRPADDTTAALGAALDQFTSGIPPLLAEAERTGSRLSMMFARRGTKDAALRTLARLDAVLADPRIVALERVVREREWLPDPASHDPEQLWRDYAADTASFRALLSTLGGAGTADDQDAAGGFVPAELRQQIAAIPLSTSGSRPTACTVRIASPRPGAVAQWWGGGHDVRHSRCAGRRSRRRGRHARGGRRALREEPGQEESACGGITGGPEWPPPIRSPEDGHRRSRILVTCEAEQRGGSEHAEWNEHPGTLLPTSICAPGFAMLNACRAVETRDVEGRLQAVAWDITTGVRHAVTNAPQGVDLCEIEPDGRFVWWFDADTAGEGIWQRQPFCGGEPSPALVGVPPGRSYGVGFNHLGSLSAVSVGIDGESRCYVGPPGGNARVVATASGYLGLIDIAPDGRLLALASRSDGPNAVVMCVPDTTTGTVRLFGDRHRRLWALEFSPDLDREPELLLAVEQDGRYTVATWRASEGLRLHDWLSFDSEISARWYEGTRRVLVQHDQAGRSRLIVGHLDRRDVREVPTPVGTILDVSYAPDGLVHYVWSREGLPPRLLVTHPAVPAVDAPTQLSADVRRGEVWTPQPYGRIHSFVTTPLGSGPWPTIFLVHGGPSTHDRDCYDSRIDAFTRAGYAVVRTNYRGSTGYGGQWQRGFGHRVGRAQIEDLAAVRAHLVGDGVSFAGRTGLCGFSWGGYLTLLAMGVQPDLWSVGLAAFPIADYVAAHRATTPALREVDQELFGGSPEQVPEHYREACPMSYVDNVRGPVLLVSSATDEKCSADQVERYARALRWRVVPHELVWVDGGHHSLRSADHASVLATMLRFTQVAWTSPSPSGPGCATHPG